MFNFHTAPDDFVAGRHNVTFPRGESKVCVNISLNPDDIALEGNEQFNVMITSVGDGAAIGSTSTSSITILDDDGMSKC